MNRIGHPDDRKVSVSRREVEVLREILAVMKLRAGASERPDRFSRPCADQAETRKDGAPIRILAISDYDGLRSSRAILLRRAGYEVETVDSQMFLEVFRVRTFDIALVCQSVSPERAVRLADILRRYHPAISLVRIVLPSSDRQPCFDLELEGLGGPEVLLNGLRSLVERRSAAAKG